MKQRRRMKNEAGLKAGIIIAFLIALTSGYTPGERPADRILGKWMSSQGNLIVEIFKEASTFKGRVVWFKDTDDKSHPMDLRTDQHNPDQSLRNRKVIGLVVLKDLTYNSKFNRWENGRIYDVKSGKEWDSSVWLTKEGLLRVKGYWHFELLGQTMTFRRI